MVKSIAKFLGFVMLTGLLGGCNATPVTSAWRATYSTSLTAIPGVDSNDIRAVQALRDKYDYFTYGMLASTELFQDCRDDKPNGYAVLLCAWLSELFGIEFRPTFYEWGELLAGLASGEVDFSGELTPTEERLKIHYMTGPIAMRNVKSFRLLGSPTMSEIVKSRPVNCLFLGGASTVEVVTSRLSVPYEITLVYDYQAAYELLLSGEGDIFFAENNVEAEFDIYNNVLVEFFLPLIYSPVALATRNQELVPIIEIMQKVLQGDDAHHLAELYNQGYKEYSQHKLFMRFTPEELDFIRSNPVVKFAAEYENYPMSFYNNREKAWQGIFFDVLAEISQGTGINFQMANHTITEWPELLSMLDKGEVSFVSELIRTPEREGKYLWPSINLLTDNYALISKTEYPSIGINEIMYARVGVPRNTAYHEVFQNWFPMSKMVIYEGSDVAFRALGEGEVDMVIASMYKLLALTNFMEETGYKANIVFDHYVESTMGFNLQEELLCSIINKSLMIVDTKRIGEQWTLKTYDYRAKLAQARTPWISGATALLVFSICLVFIYWRNRHESRRLSLLVQQRTGELEQETATLRQAEQSIIHREAMTNALNRISILFLAPDQETFEEKMTEGIEIIAEMMGVGSISVWRNYQGTDSLYTSQLFRWNGEEGGMVPPRPILQNIPLPRLTPHWHSILTGERVLNGAVREMEDPPEALSHFGVVSAFLAPLYYDNASWGFVLFEDLHQERVFTEVEFLRSVAFLCANTVIRREMDDKLGEALHHATAASRAKSEFLANMSHEIRTPMNAIIGMTAIGEKAEDSLRKDYALGKIKDASSHLLSVINDVLDISKIEANRFELSPVSFNLDKMLQKICSVINIKIEEKGLNFVMQVDDAIPRTLIGDDLRLAQVLTNILSNAVKFTDAGTVTLTASCDSLTDDLCRLRIDIKDTGIGINSEQQSRIFQAFEQAESNTTRKFGGTGLGLPISKSIIAMMQGEIWVDSQPGEGSTFSFTVDLPWSEESSTAGRSQVLAGGEGDRETSQEDIFRGRTILLAEDVAINREILLALLEPTGITIACAENGIQAVEMYSADPELYEAIFMDVQMPELDGYDATRAIRAMDIPEARSVPIIALTANVFREDVEKCLEAGMNSHIGKPLDIDEVVSELRRFLLG
ncbi:MAG: ATP-binding protein [Symbiobacteriaceae bacterium]|nr:ATP-binding protein [Symbiobacteriaceae bacterium]